MCFEQTARGGGRELSWPVTYSETSAPRKQGGWKCVSFRISFGTKLGSTVGFQDIPSWPPSHTYINTSKHDLGYGLGSEGRRRRFQIALKFQKTYLSPIPSRPKALVYKNRTHWPFISRTIEITWSNKTFKVKATPSVEKQSGEVVPSGHPYLFPLAPFVGTWGKPSSVTQGRGNFMSMTRNPWFTSGRPLLIRKNDWISYLEATRSHH